MSQFLSDSVTDNNIMFVRSQIAQKINYNMPYYARTNEVNQCITDMDSFPYKRFYRGQADKSYPIVFDRAAGWRPRFDQENSATPYLVAPSQKPDYCFEAPCSTVYPCYPQFSKKYGDAAAMAVQLNRSCVDKSP
jgi:hypothetical protein